MLPVGRLRGCDVVFRPQVLLAQFFLRYFARTVFIGIRPAVADRTLYR